MNKKQIWFLVRGLLGQVSHLKAGRQEYRVRRRVTWYKTWNEFWNCLALEAPAQEQEQVWCWRMLLSLHLLLSKPTASKWPWRGCWLLWFWMVSRIFPYRNGDKWENSIWNSHSFYSLGIISEVLFRTTSISSRPDSVNINTIVDLFPLKADESRNLNVAPWVDQIVYSHIPKQAPPQFNVTRRANKETWKTDFSSSMCIVNEWF